MAPVSRLLAGAAFLVLAGCAQQPLVPRAQDEVVSLRLLALNDFHGYMEPNPLLTPNPADPSKPIRVQAGGIAHLATLIEQLKAGHPHSLVVGAGDLIGASPLLSGLVNDEPALQAMDMIDMRVSAIGNHEFDYGQPELARLQKGGCKPRGCLLDDPYPGIDFPFISSNILRDGDGSHAYPPTHVESVGGVRIGFIGATVVETPKITSKENTAGLRFVAEAGAINASVASLRAQGIETLVVLLHEGATPSGPVDDSTCAGLSGAALDITNALDPAVDVVVTAHTHKRYTCLVNGKLLTQAESYGRFITAIDLEISRTSGDVVRKSALNHQVDPSLLPADPAFTALIARARAKTDKVALEPVANLKVPQVFRTFEYAGESALGRLIADAQLAATRAPDKGGAQIALMNHGGVRQDLPASPTPNNAITVGDCYTVHPFNNALIVMDLTGAEIKELLEQQWLEVDTDHQLSHSNGFTYQWDRRRSPGDLIVAGSLKLNGEPLVAERSYRVVTNQYLADGGGGLSVFQRGRNRSTQLLDVEALINYLKSAAPVDAPLAPRIERLDPPSAS